MELVSVSLLPITYYYRVTYTEKSPHKRQHKKVIHVRTSDQKENTVMKNTCTPFYVKSK